MKQRVWITLWAFCVVCFFIALSLALIIVFHHHVNNTSLPDTVDRDLLIPLDVFSVVCAVSFGVCIGTLMTRSVEKKKR